MQARALIMLAVAVVLGGLAAFLVYSTMQQKVEERVKGVAVQTRPVVVASVDLEVGRRLDATALKTVDWPAASVPKGAFDDPKKVLGDKEPPVVIKQMQAGEPILPFKISPPGARGGLTARIPPNQRAVTISVNEVKGVAGFVLPGDRVDILLTTQAGRGGGDTATRTLLENILVLGVDQVSSEKEDKPKVVNAVTVLVTPEQGEKLTLAQSVGSLTLLLRNETDAALASPGPVTLKDLRQAPSAGVTAPMEVAKKPVKRRVRRAASSGSSVELIKGLRITKERVKDTPLPPPASPAPAAPVQ